MCKRNRDLAVVSGFLFIMLVFLFTAISYAATCDFTVLPDIIQVDEPGDTVTELISREATNVLLTIDASAPCYATQYRLYIRCDGSPWQIITLRACDPNASRFSYVIGQPNSGCNEIYRWVVPLVSEEKTCQLAAVLLNANVPLDPNATPIPQAIRDHIMDWDISGSFTIAPFGQPGPLALAPDTASVGPGGSADYTISGGVAPYRVGTFFDSNCAAPTPPIYPNFSITRINGMSSVQTYYSGPYIFSVKNILPVDCDDTTVCVGVRDSEGTTAISEYKIDCPPYEPE